MLSVGWLTELGCSRVEAAQFENPEGFRPVALGFAASIFSLVPEWVFDSFLRSTKRTPSKRKDAFQKESEELLKNMGMDPSEEGGRRRTRASTRGVNSTPTAPATPPAKKSRTAATPKRGRGKKDDDDEEKSPDAEAKTPKKRGRPMKEKEDAEDKEDEHEQETNKDEDSKDATVDAKKDEEAKLEVGEKSDETDKKEQDKVDAVVNSTEKQKEEKPEKSVPEKMDVDVEDVVKEKENKNESSVEEKKDPKPEEPTTTTTPVKESTPAASVAVDVTEPVKEKAVEEPSKPAETPAVVTPAEEAKETSAPAPAESAPVQVEGNGSSTHEPEESEVEAVEQVAIVKESVKANDVCSTESTNKTNDVAAVENNVDETKLETNEPKIIPAEPTSVEPTAAQ
ncbi:muscle M-line assembly protein unc-89 isoform X2 [Wyeomyia smithii]|uniref:muscle M-line assembly protein unc-89 isoform X2 n=1 Tax=Wyeomyia smithii TaxID=174621 RepID=UPI002467B856|nr:muscle M-line assembly protein unc-89 isoform X2 [Wyeomyia smithii]